MGDVSQQRMVTSDEIPRYSAKKPPMKWECSISECKILSETNVCTIIDLDIVFAGGAWIKTLIKKIGTLLPKKELMYTSGVYREK